MLKVNYFEKLDRDLSRKILKLKNFFCLSKVYLIEVIFFFLVQNKEIKNRFIN